MSPPPPSPQHNAYLIPFFVTATPLIPSDTASSSLTSACKLRVVRRRARPKASCTLSGLDSAFEDDFFIGADDLHLIKNNPTFGDEQPRVPRSSEDAKPNSPRNLTISQRRTEEKRMELARASRRNVEDDDEIRRDQLAGEELSAADLLGIVDGNSPIPKHDIYPDEPDVSTAPVRRKWTHANADVILGPDPALQTNDAIHSEKLKRKAPRPSNPKLASTTGRKPQSRAPASTMPQPPPPRTIRPLSTPLQIPETSIRPGNLVIHSRHGIGRFRGLERTVASHVVIEEGSPPPIQEFAVIEYRDGDVYVPLSHFEALRRLTPDEVKDVRRLDTVSGATTYSDKGNNTRVRRSRHIARMKTRSKIRKQLVNLHGLYAERASIERDPFPVDKVAESSFYASCSFQLTADQEEATKQVLFDMSFRRQPMDRLLCGDVGFGKTEVAIRAAYRALCAGKQVAVLAPTTILAQQHYETFRERFTHLTEDKFSIACLTRFMPRKANLQSRENIKSGLIRVAVGTHMMLGDAFEFENLGLLIVDEEHRFGVNQKEKIRSRYRAVDTLFLSATPIPRTLHLTLSGLRDASVLRIPPEGRKPVITRISASGAGVIREAIGHELERGGQSFFVVPRIDGIEASANQIRDLFPKIRVLVAHGAMNDLERRIWSFAKREYDVLVCTTIIENGINMPDVNTVVIENASRFGLAQLHQLRGRVGRSDIQAYAWMLYSQAPGGYSLPAYERLKVLEKNSDLGSGFAIAQRDMEMRGVGTILGVEQHGNTSINAEEYAKMLSEELEHARTGKPIPISLPEATSCEVFLPVPSFIPTDYISDFDQKISAYGFLSNATSMKALYSVVKDLELRYGPMPSPTRKHVHILELRLRARDLGVSRVFTERQHVVMDWQVEESAFNCLVAFLPDEQSRSRFQLVSSEERVVVRGLGICNGDVQLAKLRSYFFSFAKAAEGFQKPPGKKGSEGPGLADSLYEIAADESS